MNSPGEVFGCVDGRNLSSAPPQGLQTSDIIQDLENGKGKKAFKASLPVDEDGPSNYITKGVLSYSSSPTFGLRSCTRVKYQV